MFASDRFDSVPMAFWETLGQYVYGYMEQDKFVYIGKGNKNRALSHVKTKNYDTDNLYIIARNLENFRGDKDDLQSFILESFLIATNDPRDNSVAGHYKECFVMAKFSELFEEFKKDQHDNFETMPDWFTDNYEKLAGRIGVLTIKSTHHNLEFSTIEQLQPYLQIDVDEEVQLRVANRAKGAARETRYRQLVTFCEALGIEEAKVQRIGKEDKTTGETYEIMSGEMDIDLAMQFIDDFFS